MQGCGAAPISDEPRAVALLSSGATYPDQLAAELGISADAAATLIADLLLSGEIVSTADGRFARA